MHAKRSGIAGDPKNAKTRNGNAVELVVQRAGAVLLPAHKEEKLEKCEGQIQGHLHSFYDAGCALRTIKNDQLYEKYCLTFEDYCECRWHFSRAYGYRLIAAAEIYEILLTIGDILMPVNEAQIRALVGLDSKAVLSVWTKVVEEAHEKPITAKLVKTVRAELIPVEKEISKRPHKQKPDESGELIKLLEKAKLYVERGYQEEVIRILDEISNRILPASCSSSQVDGSKSSGNGQQPKGGAE